MDVPFISSGAMSRAHYALTRKVEGAASPADVDHLLFAEIENVRVRLSHSALSAKQTRECLILLLYSTMNITSDASLPDLDWALRHAVNLAEAGQSMKNKRIGYLYCAEMMPPSHELQLMLVNTLRKDLDSLEVPRICLALEALIQSPNGDVIPAIQDRLQELLVHNSAYVRRRTLLAYRALATCESELLNSVAQKTRHRMKDVDPTVACAALSVCSSLLEAGLFGEDKVRPILLKLLQETWRSRTEDTRHWLLVKILQTISLVKPCIDTVKLCLDIVHACSSSSSAHVVLQQCFLVASRADLELVIQAQSSAGTTFVEHVRSFLTASDPNHVYLFVSCLEALDPKLWAGTTPDLPAVLESWEVERVMQLLDSPDPSLRKKTLRLLTNVDPNIVDAYFAQLLQASETLTGAPEKEEAAKRALEIIHTLRADDGEGYAQHITKLVGVLCGSGNTGKPYIMQSLVEDVLSTLRHASASFRSTCLGVLFASLDPDQDSDNGHDATLTVILAAVVCEYADLSPLSPPRLLQGLAQRLPTQSAAVQDALLLSMMKGAANCDAVPDNVGGVVAKVQEQGGRLIRRRCEQFTRLVQSKKTLTTIVGQARSHSLPDFLVALETYEATKDEQSTIPSSTSPPSSPPRPDSRASSHMSQTPGKLRYTAYDAPKATPRLRRKNSYAHSDSGSSRFVGQGNEDDALSKTVTAGDLALASGQIELQAIVPKSPKAAPSLAHTLRAMSLHEEPAGVDLIALDSPFIAEPRAETSEASRVAEQLDFEGAWGKLSSANLRGWCDSPIDVVVRRLQGMQRKMSVTAADEQPFQGDLKIFIPPDQASVSNNEGFAALRLREGEEESCLWHLRCEDGDLRSSIRTLLTDA